MSIIRVIEAWLMRRMYHKWRRLGEILYPDPDMRASALLAEGTELQEIVEVGKGQTIGQIIIVPDPEEGYHIHVEDAKEIAEGRDE